MQCISHPERQAANTCNQCGHWLCDECNVDVQGRLYCRSCLAAMASDGRHETYSPPPARSHGRRINWGLLFLFSCFFPPGANYMFMGLIKRGLAAMCGFFLIIWMTAVAPTGLLTMLFSFAIAVYSLTCIFDGFHIRRRINSGEIVPDGINDLLGAVLGNKTLTIAIIIVLIIVFAGSLLNLAVGLISRAIPIIIIGLVLYAIFKRKGGSR